MGRGSDSMKRNYRGLTFKRPHNFWTKFGNSGSEWHCICLCTRFERLGSQSRCNFHSFSQLPIISTVLIKVTGLIFKNSTYNRKSCAVTKINSTIYLLLEQYIYLGRATMEQKIIVGSTRNQSSTYSRISVYNRKLRVRILQIPT